MLCRFCCCCCCFVILIHGIKHCLVRRAWFCCYETAFVVPVHCSWHIMGWLSRAHNFLQQWLLVFVHISLITTKCTFFFYFLCNNLIKTNRHFYGLVLNSMFFCLFWIYWYFSKNFRLLLFVDILFLFENQINSLSAWTHCYSYIVNVYLKIFQCKS